MKRLSGLFFVRPLGLTAALCVAMPGAVNAEGPNTSTVRVATGLSSPLFATAAPDDPSRLFIVERGSGGNANIRILDLTTQTMHSEPFLTVPGLITGNERGLLGMTFHPDYADNGLFYINATFSGGTQGITRIREYSVAGDPLTSNIADATSARDLLSIDQPFSNHNGGWIGFNPAIEPGQPQYLYIATGDGGGSNDPLNTGQRLDTLHGKLLRVDVNSDDFPDDASRNYAIPSDNPFVGETGLDEIWAYGLRNPWRNSFDRMTGDLWIADVGQNAREEINFQPHDSPGGENYGWRLREGTIETPTGGVGGPPPPGAIDPIYEYTHGTGPFQGQSVTGGYLYRGPVTELQGLYIFADFISDNIWALDPSDLADPQVVRINDWLTPDVGQIQNISSFGEDAVGNLYIVSLNGHVFMIVPEPGSIVLLAGAGLLLVRRKCRA
ncbi:MAG: PQQ-dependent sugar dehydrogenase [Phycisphaeraceae bacterium]|nr:PQQ-dependent sugar dehydrogenase [Phycisphaeraceae bacterium]